MVCSGECTPASVAASLIRNTGAGSRSGAVTDSLDLIGRCVLFEVPLSSSSRESSRSTKAPTVLSNRSSLILSINDLCSLAEIMINCTFHQRSSLGVSFLEFRQGLAFYQSLPANETAYKCSGSPESTAGIAFCIEGKYPWNRPRHSSEFCTCDIDRMPLRLCQISKEAFRIAYKL